MISQSFKRSAVVLGAMAVTTFGYADGKWYDTIGISGYTQASYVGNLNSPHAASTSVFPAPGSKLSNTGRQLDTDSNGFAFNTFLLQVAKPVGDSDHYGFTVRLRTGQDAQTLSGNNLWVQEAYLTYAVPSTKLSIIGGKFVTPEGYEVVDTVSNPNFSLGLLFFAAEPITHTGLKANYVLSDKANVTLGVVNGWDALPGNQGAPDINDGKTILWQVATTPTKQITWSFQGTYGKEMADPTHSQRLSLDTVLGFNPMDKVTLALQGNWGQDTHATATDGTTHWSGLGLWASFAETAKCTTSARFEVLKDQNNANRFGAGAFATTGTPNQTVKEFTITQKHMVTTAMGVRAEYRHDWSNEAYFVKHDGSAVRNQNTISADWFVTF